METKIKKQEIRKCVLCNSQAIYYCWTNIYCEEHFIKHLNKVHKLSVDKMRF